MPDNDNLPNQGEGIFNVNKTQKDASTENEVQVVPHKDINPEENQTIANIPLQKKETPTLGDVENKPTQIEKGAQVDQEGNIISAGVEQQATEEKQKKEEIKEPAKKTNLSDLLSGTAAAAEPEDKTVEKVILPVLSGQSNLAFQNIFQDIYNRAMGKPVPQNEHDIFGQAVIGMTDFTVQTITSGFSLAKELNNAFSKDGLVFPKDTLAKIEKYYDDSVFGKVDTELEKETKENAISRLTSEILQVYTFWEAGSSLALSGVRKAKQLMAGEEGIEALATAQKLTDDYIKAAKNNKLIVPNENIVEAYKKAQQLNELSGAQKFGLSIIGGSIGSALVSDYQDIGTFALDKLGFGMDTDVKNDSQEDAVRRLYNRGKFAIDNAFVTFPIAYGLGKIGALISQQGKDLAFSDSLLDTLIDKVSSQFRSRGPLSQELFEAKLGAEGQIKSAKNTARDMLIDINKTISNISKTSGIDSGTPAWETMMEKLNDLLIPDNHKIEMGRVLFNGLDPDKLVEFNQFAKNAKLEPEQVVQLKTQIITAREQFKDFMNTLLSNGNIQTNAKEFNKIMSDRIKNMFTSDYKIFTQNNSIVPMFNYKPASDVLQDAGDILAKFAKKNGRILTQNEIDVQMKDILKNVKLDPLSKKPVFTINSFSPFGGDTTEATQAINIGDSFKGGDFKPTKFFKTQKDLDTYLKLFGEKMPDVRTVIANTMTDLGTLVSKDNFYNGILEKNNELIKNGERGILYSDRLTAQTELPNKDIILDKNGIQIESSLKNIYSNPINGLFTSEDWKKALTFNDKMISDELSKNILWRTYKSFFLLPKASVQLSKTIFNQFTHMKVFVANHLFTLGNGNFFVDPKVVVSSFKDAFNALQPQLLYRNTPKDLQLYNFLLDRGVVYSSSTAEDLKGMIKDMSDGGTQFIDKLFNKFGNFLQKLTNALHDSYMAGDDHMKIYNFMVENYKYRNAYADLLKNGKITELEVMDKVAKIVANTMPNYNYVGNFVKATRLSPLGNFPSFYSEVIRTGYNTLELGLMEAKDPITRSIGLKRLLGFGTVTAVAFPVVSQIVRGISGITKDEDTAARQFVPEYSKYSNLFLFKDKEGNYKYIDPSSFDSYEALKNPAQSVIAAVNSDMTFAPQSTLKQSIEKGLTSAFVKAKAPFIDESIIFKLYNDLVTRNGITKEGVKIWNPEAPVGDKFVKGLEYSLMQVAPFDIPADKRIYHAITGTPGPRGEKYELGDELGRGVGLRAIPLDPKKDLPIQLSTYKDKFKNDVKLFTGETLGKLPTSDDIVQNYIKANAALYNNANEMYIKKQAANTLGVNNPELFKIFKDSSEEGLYKSLQANKFKPLDITTREQQIFKQQAKEINQNFDNVNYTMPYDPTAVRTVNQLKNIMRRIPYGQNFYDYINPQDWRMDKEWKPEGQPTVPVTGKQQSFNIAPVNTPNVNPQTVTPNPQQTVASQNEFQRAFPQG